MTVSSDEKFIQANRVTGSEKQEQSAQTRPLILWLLLLTIAKLFLIAHEEMQASFMPHDDLWQVWAAARSYWEGAYAPTYLYHLPVYPLFLRLTSATGIPFRVVMELLYCGAASALTLAAVRISVPKGVAGFAAVVVILHPASFQLPNRFGAEILLAPLIMLALAASINWWVERKTKRSWCSVIWASIFWALAWNTRKEAVVLIPIFGILGLCLWWVDREDGWRCLLRRMALGVCIPMAACIALSTVFKTINYARWGLFANSVLTAPGFTAAFKSLQKIRPDHPIDYIPVTVEMRRKAYEASPTLKKLEPQMEEDIGKFWASLSKGFTDAKGLGELNDLEISAGWSYWALYEAAIASGVGKDPGEVDRYFATVANEINAAFAEGRLQSRFVPIALIDPDIRRWGGRLGASLALVYGTQLSPAVPVRSAMPPLPPEVANLYDRFANRRANLLQAAPCTLDGWILGGEGKAVSFELRSGGGRKLPTSVSTFPRPDVKGSLGFRVSAPNITTKEWENACLITKFDGDPVKWPVKGLKSGRVEHQEHNQQMVHLGCDNAIPPFFSKLWKLQAKWERGYYRALRWLQWAALAGILLAAIHTICGRKLQELPLLALLGAAVGSRIFLFAILDASAWSGNQPRYLFAVMPLHAVLLVLGAWLLLREGAVYFRSGKKAF